MRLRFTLGPVQELVRKSRRTRDLWASSFLLSYLAGCAMAAAREHGELILPLVDDDPLFQRIRAGHGGGPSIGSLPNRFELETGDAERTKRAVQAAREGLDAGWKQICDAVWGRYLAPVAARGRETETIFRRQVGSFWEIQWVAAESDDAMRGLLERRKAWRSRIPTTEPGDKCVVMPELQELSGFVRAHSSGEAAAQDAFWEALRETGQLSAAELRRHERLSGVALVKRLYARTETAQAALGWDPETSRWRSTVYVAAVPWIREVTAKTPDACRTYAEGVLALDERAHKEITLRTGTARIADGAGAFDRLDGNYFFVDALVNEDMTLPGVAADEPRRKALGEALRALYKTGGEAPVGPPATSYALLLMDGDHIGRLLGAPEGAARVSTALSAFTKEVAGIVEEHDGRAVYAGGDDVLAMLPVPSALACAWALRAAYRRCFSNAATTSAAVVFAQIRQPLREVLEEAHRQLDDVAKEQNGRDSIAVSYLRRGDRAFSWVSTWDEPGTEATRLDAITKLRDMWRNKAERHRRGEGGTVTDQEVSGSLLFRVRDLMGMLCGWQRWEPGICRAYTLGEPQQVQALLAAEIRRAFRAGGLEEGGGDSAARDQALQREADRMAHELLQVSHPAERKAEGPVLDRQRVGLDGVLLARFLSTDGKERDHGAMEGPR